MLTQRLRHRVELQSRSESRDSETGGVIVSWITATVGGVQLSAVPAEVLTGPGREFRESATKMAETTARITLRWFSVDRLELCRWRVLWEGRVYDIVSAETDATARREWRLRCIDGLTDGQ